MGRNAEAIVHGYRRTLADVGLASAPNCERLRNQLREPVEFFATAERHLRSTGKRLPDVPESGLRRRVHVQIAFDLTQSLLDHEDSGDEYDGLFVHAFRICTGNRVSIAETAQKDQTQLDAPDEEAEDRAAASILGSSALKLLSKDKRDVHDAIEALTQAEKELPISEDNIPPLLPFGIEIAGEMQCTLCRLPYLPPFGIYDRPCRPLLA